MLKVQPRGIRPKALKARATQKSYSQTMTCYVACSSLWRLADTSRDRLGLALRWAGSGRAWAGRPDLIRLPAKLRSK